VALFELNWKRVGRKYGSMRIGGVTSFQSRVCKLSRGKFK